MTSHNWQEVALSDVCSLITDGTHHSPPNGASGDFKYITAKNIKASGLDLGDITYVSADVHDEIYRRCPPEKGDVLYIKDGATTGVSAINTLDEPFSMLSSVALLKPIREALLPAFLSHWLNSPSTFTAMTSSMTGSAIRRLVLSQIRETRLFLPPLSEQHRIVAKIDSLFARSSRARDELAHISKLIERYRQAVLEAAFRGDLTADWRALHPVRAAGSRLDTLLAERRTRWQAAQSLARRKTYPQPEEADFFPEIDLPEGWTWASVDQLTTEMQYGTSAKTNGDATGIPVLRMGNIVRGELQVDNLKYLPADHDEFPTLLLHDGDILFNRTNSPELVGKTAVFKGQLPRASFASYLIRLKAVGILPSLLSAYINSPYGRSWVASVVSQQVGQANVNGTKLSRLAVPLIPDEEQVILDQRISAAMTAIDAMEREMLRATTMIDRLDQSILDKAFTGKLVPQDPTDEPASKLLERIRAARAAAPKAKRGQKATG